MRGHVNAKADKDTSNAQPRQSTMRLVRAAACARRSVRRAFGPPREASRDRPERLLGCLGCGQCMAICPTSSITINGRNLSPGDMIDLTQESAKATPQQLEALLRPRRSIRHFREEEVTRELVDRILDMSTAAPMESTFSGRDCGLPRKGQGEGFLRGCDGLIEESIEGLDPATLVLFRPFISKADYEG